MTDARSASRAPPARRQLAFTFLLASMTALGPFSIDMYLPAIPTMGAQLGASPGAVQLTVGVFMIGHGAGQLLFGPLSDRLGRRGPAIFGLALYIAACVGCAMAINVESLIAFRFLQALGVCAGQVVARAVLADLFEPRELASFSSLLTMITLVAPIIAPLIGGFIFVTVGWRAVFWSLMGYGAVVLAAILLKFPETRTTEAKALSRAESTLGSYIAVGRNWPLMQVGLAAGFAQAAFVTYLGAAPHLIIETFGVPAAQFGWYFAANSVGLWLGSYLNRRLLRRHEPAAIVRWACVFFLFATLVIVAAVHIPATGKWGVLVPLFFMIGAFPIVVGNSNAIAQGLDRTRGGAVAAVLGALGSLLGALAIGVNAGLGRGAPEAMAWVMAGGAALCVLLFLGRRGRA